VGETAGERERLLDEPLSRVSEVSSRQREREGARGGGRQRLLDESEVVGHQHQPAVIRVDRLCDIVSDHIIISYIISYLRYHIISYYHIMLQDTVLYHIMRYHFSFQVRSASTSPPSYALIASAMSYYMVSQDTGLYHIIRYVEAGESLWFAGFVYVIVIIIIILIISYYVPARESMLSMLRWARVCGRLALYSIIPIIIIPYIYKYISYHIMYQRESLCSPCRGGWSARRAAACAAPTTRSL
jgi:magnesium-transporting ATPase (P-type)